MMTEDEELIKISNLIVAARKLRDESIEKFVDFRIERGDYQPSERTQKIADMISFCDALVKDSMPTEH
jgi:hypothetical protein